MIITCLIGDPVEHSVSPIMYNYFAQKAKLEYAHIKVRILSKPVDNLKKAVEAIKLLGFRGANITLPFKMEVQLILS